MRLRGDVVMEPTSSPADCRERMAVSRPEPGPLTNTSTFFRPCSIALRAADSAAIPAAYGVDLREPLKPTSPPDAQDSTAPDGSVIEMMVLLKVDLMCACPTGTDLRSRRRGLRAACLFAAIDPRFLITNCFVRSRRWSLRPVA